MFHAAIAVELPVHPNRLPLHNDPEKGQILGGACNAFGCSCLDARHWCALSFAFYCADCALEINLSDTPSCEEVSEKPTLPEMQQRFRHAHKAYRV